MRLALRGRHQAANAVVAVRLLEELHALGIPVHEAAIVAGLTDVVWRGRLDLVDVDDGHQVLFDGAHNPAGARTLAAYLGEAHPGGWPIVFGAMRDKDAAEMIAVLAAHATRFILTEPHSPRAAPAVELARLALHHAASVPVDIEPDPHAALALGLRSSPLVIVAGSLFLVGELLPPAPSHPLR